MLGTVYIRAQKEYSQQYYRC